MKKKYSLFLLLIVFLYSPLWSIGQSYWEKPPNHFGIQYKPLIPINRVGDKPFSMKEGNFETEIKPSFGYSYGAAVRIGISELLAIETGMNYIKRRYTAEYSVVDSNLVASDRVGYVSFEIPVNLLVYVQLGKTIYMNVSGGVSTNFNPSNIRSVVIPDPYRLDLFIFEGKRLHYFDFNANAEIGFEYRTEEAGIFYLGGYAKIPFTPILAIATEYRHDTKKQVAYEGITGATFGLSLKYFFKNSKNKRSDSQRIKGPIEQ